MTSRQLERFVTTGLLVTVFAGVYRDAIHPFELDERARAAALAGGNDAVVSHRMAVALWGMRNYRCDLFEITASVKTLGAG